jgi:hypothetical protein
VIPTIFVLSTQAWPQQTVTLQVSAFANIQQETNPASRTALSIDPAEVPIAVVPGQQLMISAPGCVISYFTICESADGKPILNGQGLYLGCQVYSLIGQWSTSPSILDNSTAVGTFVCAGSSVTLTAPSATPGPYYLFLAENDGYFDDNSGAFTVTAQGGCLVNFQQSVTSFPAGPPSRDLKPTTMNGIFVPQDLNGNSISLASAAKDCGFDMTQGFSGFNWQQTITNLPRPSPYATVDGTPLVTPFLDPPTPLGYTYDPAGTANLYPFYYDPNSCAFQDVFDVCVIPVEQGMTVLNFFDHASDSCLPGGTGEGCYGLTAPPGPNSDLEFTTTLVGVSTASTPQNAICGANSTLYCTPLYWWRWKSTFNGTSGGVSKLNDQVLDPGSGTGGVTITSINGITQTPPFVSCAVVGPNRSGPPQGPYEVEIFGRVAAGTQPLAAGGTTYAVVDDYGNVESSGSFTPNGDGSYSFEVSRKEVVGGPNNFQQDPTLTIVVNAMDKIGNVGSCSILVGALPNRYH